MCAAISPRFAEGWSRQRAGSSPPPGGRAMAFTRSSAPRPRVWMPSVRWRFSRAATPSPGTATGRRSFAKRPRYLRATGFALPFTKASSIARCAAIMDPTIKDFESASAELEAIVKKMEEGDLTLEKALELYERGVQLSRFCHSKLEERSEERRVGKE